MLSRLWRRTNINSIKVARYLKIDNSGYGCVGIVNNLYKRQRGDVPSSDVLLLHLLDAPHWATLRSVVCLLGARLLTNSAIIGKQTTPLGRSGCRLECTVCAAASWPSVGQSQKWKLFVCSLIYQSVRSIESLSR